MSTDQEHRGDGDNIVGEKTVTHIHAARAWSDWVPPLVSLAALVAGYCFAIDRITACLGPFDRSAALSVVSTTFACVGCCLAFVFRKNSAEHKTDQNRNR